MSLLKKLVTLLQTLLAIPSAATAVEASLTELDNFLGDE